MIAAAAGVLARHGIHGGKWIPGVIGAVFTGAFMALGTWSTTEKSIQLRELRGRRLRQALMEEDDAVPLRPGDPVRLLIARQPTALER